MTFNEIDGDIIALALEGNFDVIAHGCNCFCKMENGLAPIMAATFGCDKFKLEDKKYIGDINKLGQIDYEKLYFSNWDKKFEKYPDEGDTILHSIYAVNAYTQFRYGANHADGVPRPFDVDAFTLCMRKLNHEFDGLHIGLPRIGAGLAGGDWNIIKEIIKKEIKDCNVTIVTLTKTRQLCQTN